VAAHAAENAPHTGGWAVEGDGVGALLVRIRRYWVLVLVVTAVAVVGAFAATRTAETSYVGRSSLIVASNNRSPDQDAVLVQGYVTYFNDAAYQQELLARAEVPDGVAVSAEAAAASPILVISATTGDPGTAQSYAIQVANAFRDDINRVPLAARAEELVLLQDQLDTALSSPGQGAQVLVAELQDRIEQVRANQVNLLQELQAQGGVSVQSPSLVSNLLPAVAGGLLLGVLGAIALASVSRRLHNGLDVAHKVGLHTLVELPRRRGRSAQGRRQQRLGQLANIARVRLTGPGVVALAQAEDGVASAAVARELAHQWAGQGYPTVLVSIAGSVLDGAEAASPRLRPGPVAGLSLLELTPPSGDEAPALSVTAISELLEQEALAGQYVVIPAPAVVGSAAAQAICHAADQTVLVVDTVVTRVAAAREAVAVLRQMGAPLMGAVVVSMGADPDEGAAHERPAVTWSRESSETRPAGARDLVPSDVNGHAGRPPVAGSPSGVPHRGAPLGRE
jgi:capsular polysaccharide biosynthesis protein